MQHGDMSDEYMPAGNARLAAKDTGRRDDVAIEGEGGHVSVGV
jgi:hypothetical protein